MLKDNVDDVMMFFFEGVTQKKVDVSVEWRQGARGGGGWGGGGVPGPVWGGGGSGPEGRRPVPIVVESHRKHLPSQKEAALDAVAQRKEDERNLYALILGLQRTYQLSTEVRTATPRNPVRYRPIPGPPAASPPPLPSARHRPPVAPPNHHDRGLNPPPPTTHLSSSDPVLPRLQLLQVRVPAHHL